MIAAHVHPSPGCGDDGPSPGRSRLPDAGGTIEDLRIGHSGDGVDIAEDAGDVVIRRSYFHDLHDDAVTVEDSLFERIVMGLAYKRRSGAGGCASGRGRAARRPPHPRLALGRHHALRLRRRDGPAVGPEVVAPIVP